MIITYRGKNLEIDQDIVSLYKKYTGYDITKNTIDLYINNHIINNPESKCDDILQFINSSSNSDLKSIIEIGLLDEVETCL